MALRRKGRSRPGSRNVAPLARRCSVAIAIVASGALALSSLPELAVAQVSMGPAPPLVPPPSFNWPTPSTTPAPPLTMPANLWASPVTGPAPPLAMPIRPQPLVGPAPPLTMPIGFTNFPLSGPAPPLQSPGP